MDSIIEFHNVHKAFGHQKVLDDVSLTIPRGKTTVIIGPSGTGKSVTIKLLVGLMKPDAGEIYVSGREITRLKERDLYEVRKKFGMLFQDGALFDSMTVGENIAFPLRQHTKKSDREIKEIVAMRLAQVGLPGVEYKFPGELSGGMRKRVGIARALVLEPEIVLFDEPNSGLDPVMSDAIDKLILKLQHELGMTFVVISHDLDGTFQIADRIAMLYKARCIAEATKDEVKNSDNPILRQFFSRSSDGPIQVV
ncbi:MAG: ABC transporter ATP-binding protein [Candidatus Sericytochromatia bacterium]